MFIDLEGDFRVNMFRITAINRNSINDINDTNNDTNDTNNDTNESIILRLIGDNPSITQEELKDKLNVSIITVKRLMAKLQNDGRIRRMGSSRSGTWLIIDQK